MKAVPDLLVDPRESVPLHPAHIDVAHAFALRDDVDDELEASLAIARRGRGWTFLSFPAPIVAASSLVAAFRSAPIVAWSSQALTIVGVGAAYELRGTGEDRWLEVIAAARRLETSAILNVGSGRDATRDERRRDIGRDTDMSGRGELERRALARPRLLGGLAFAPGAADGAPWTGFGDAWFMLPRWTYVHDGMHAVLLLAVDARDAQHATRWRDELAAIRSALATTFVARPQPPLTTIDHGDRDAWRDQVRAITDAIDRGDYAKIVAARTAIVSLAGEARAADMLAELDARHADCVRVLVRPPGGGALIAATPERLVRLDGAKVACDALAGSLARTATERVDHVDARHNTNGARHDANGAQHDADATHEHIDARRDANGPRHDANGARRDANGARRDANGAWRDAEATHIVTAERVAGATLLASAKDRREHDLVVHAITSALREVGADVDVPAEPGVRTLRHVLHLHTPIAATLREPRHVLEVAAALHPTPAVGGTPTRVATDWIAAREVVPRGWYAAPVGWFDLDGNGELAVAIRSGLLAGERAHLWAGAGIVAGSDPDRELAETEIKLRAMLGALGVAR